MERNPPLKQNFLNNLPDEIIRDIQSYLYNKDISLYLTLDYVRYRDYLLRNLYLIFKDSCIKPLVHNIHKILNYIKKYNAYQRDYDQWIRCEIRNIDKDYKLEMRYNSGELSKSRYHYYYDMIECKYLKPEKKHSSPILIDILNSGNGLPCSQSTMKYFDNVTDYNAIWEILKLFPDCIHSDYGLLRCRNYITPLAAACYNDSIPVTIIEQILKEYPDCVRTIVMNGYTLSIIDDIAEINPADEPHRITEMKKIFNKY